MSSVPMLNLLGLGQGSEASQWSQSSHSAATSLRSTSPSSKDSKVSWLPSLARQVTSDGTLDVKDVKAGSDGRGETHAVPTPRVAEPLPVLLGRTRFNPQRRNADSEACAQAAREAFLERQARRASRVTG